MNEFEQTQAEEFALSICFNDGCCPICKQRVYSKNNESKYHEINVDLDKGIEHYKLHVKERGEVGFEYEYN